LRLDRPTAGRRTASQSTGVASLVAPRDVIGTEAVRCAKDAVNIDLRDLIRSPMAIHRRRLRRFAAKTDAVRLVATFGEPAEYRSEWTA
jgi:hypothetical protein